MRFQFIQVVLTVLICSSAGAENAEYWLQSGRKAIERAKNLKPINGHAKNVILFLGDGMDITTVTAARILEGQQRGEPGEENLLSFERFPYTCLSKTYNTNAQTPDSSGCMTAIITGAKTTSGVVSVNQNVTRGDHRAVEGNKLTTLLELAERAGLATGVVTTATVVHATPAACYAHSPERNWYDDAFLSPEARQADFPDLARQLIEFPVGDGLEVVLGGGRQHFLPVATADPERPAVTGRRLDGRDLTVEWLTKKNSAYVWNRKQFDAIDPDKTDHLLGLFEPSHMNYESDRAGDLAGEPSLTHMTQKAIELLSKKGKGYFLMVEGARIDHGHHACNAYRALTDTLEFASAVRVAIEATRRQDTLIVVTADHAHGLAMTGYATRGNPILGKVRTNDMRGLPAGLALDGAGRPYTSLVYAMGPGYVAPVVSEGSPLVPHGSPGAQKPSSADTQESVPAKRRDLRNVDTAAEDYLFECALPGSSAPHGGQDVAVYADGPMAHLFHGVQEQHYIFHVMAEALGLDAASRAN